MQSYQTKLKMPKGGELILHEIPFPEGEEVTVTVEASEKINGMRRKFPYRGKPFKFSDPFAPVFDENAWDALKQ